ncbi:hypothetical protein CPB86DRAFT_789162 [Serendipita vermifera]|nr:hypothetical protein CPB86DRAFT_789162 [Serendipita vermifera]
MSMSSEEYFKICDHALGKFLEHCTQPCPTDPFVQERWTMCGVHTTFAEAMKQMYKLADTITPKDEQDFAMYCFAFTQNLHHHHHLEETIMFPLMEPEFKTNVVDEHAAFHDALEDLENYIHGILGTKQGKIYGDIVKDTTRQKIRYNAEKFKKLLETLITPLMTHLLHEIEWLDPEKIRASGLTAQRLHDMEEQVLKHIKEQANPFVIHVQVLGHLPPNVQWPPMPWFVKKILVPWVFYWKHSGAWRYLPYM